MLTLVTVVDCNKRLYHRNEIAAPDYRDDRTLPALMTCSQQHAPLVRGGAKVVTDGRLHDTHAPGCIISGVLLVNRVPGNFHIEVRTSCYIHTMLHTCLPLCV
jgi:hypothetical protein